MGASLPAHRQRPSQGAPGRPGSNAAELWQAPRDAAVMLDRAIAQWRAIQGDLWVFGYASLIWHPEFGFSEQRPARVMGYHRALKMWSRVNRGTPECPGLVFALLSGGSCQGVVFRIPELDAEAALRQLWPREMPNAVYDPKWLRCQTDAGDISALAFTLSRRSASFTGDLSPAQYRQIFNDATGRYGTTWDYARQTLEQLDALGIHDASLARLLRLR